MANNYQQFSEVIEDLTKEEIKWLKNVLTAETKEHKSFVALLEKEGDDSAEQFPDFNWEFKEQSSWDEDKGEYIKTGGKYLWLFAEESGDINHVGLLVQEFLRLHRPKEYFTLQWADWCDKLRVGEFSGGALFVTAEQCLLHTTSEWVFQQQEKHERKNNK